MKMTQVQITVSTDDGIVLGEYTAEYTIPAMATTFLAEVMTVVKLTVKNPTAPVTYHVRVSEAAE